jgi:hypothetical protein
MHDLKLDVPSLVSLIWSIQPLLIGSASHKAASKLPPAVPSLLLAAPLATEQIMDFRHTLRSSGVLLDGKACMSGDNQSVMTGSTIPRSSLNKCHNAPLHHRVREAIASDVSWFFHVSGKMNPANVLAKFCGHLVFWPLIQPHLFWHGKPSKFSSKPTTKLIQGSHCAQR